MRETSVVETESGRMEFIGELGSHIYHRLDGAAIINYLTGEEHWFYYGERIRCSNQYEFNRIIKLKILW